MMAKDLRIFKYFPLILALSMMVCGLIWLGVGLSVKSLVAQGMLSALDHPDQAVTVFIERFTPSWLGSVAYIGIVAAIMSTADSFLNVGAAALTRDLPKTLGIKVLNELLWGRVSVVVIFTAALLFAFQMKTLVGYLGIFSFGTFAASLVPVLALGLNWERANRLGVMLSILTGLSLSLLLEGFDRVGLFTSDLPPALFALSGSMLVFLACGWLKRRPS
jgi:Na+/proline symporter